MARARTVGIALAAAALGLTSASFALGRIYERRQPLLSAALPTTNGIALAEEAEHILSANMTSGPDPKLSLNGSERSRVLALSRRAYASEPLSVAAVRNIGLIASAEGDEVRARTLMGHAARITRRDLSTNAWLARDHGERGEVQPALAALDHALRTSSAGQQMLLPAMLNMLTRPELVEPLVGLLRHEPAWAERFWVEAPRHRAAIVNVAKIRIALNAEGMRGDDSRNLALLRALTAEREFDTAETLFDAVAERPKAAGELLRNSHFDRASRFEPFDWRLFFDSTMAADIIPARGVMQINTFADGSGLVARQLLKATGGSHVLSINAVDWDALDARALEVRLRCAESAGGTAVDPLPVTRPEFVTRIAITGEGCGYYWLELHALAQPERQNNTVTLDSVILRREVAGSE